MTTVPTPTAPSTGGAYRIEALARGLRVLRLFDESTKSLRLVDICARTGLPMPTAFRIVTTLETEAFLRRRRDGSFEPSLAVLTLGSAALRGSDLVQAAASPLEWLSERTGETVNLGVLDHARVLYLVRIQNDDLVTANVQVGSTLPAVYTSMGKALLAALPDERLDALLPPETFERSLGPNAVPDLASLRLQLNEVRALGYAIQNEELATGLRSVSVCLCSAALETPAAINVAVAAHRRSVEDLEGPLLTAVREAAAEITTRLEKR